jgi:hypothetical protein
MNFYFKEVDSPNELIGLDTYYLLGKMENHDLLINWETVTHKDMRMRYKGIRLFKKITKPKFKTAKPYPFGY